METASCSTFTPSNKRVQKAKLVWKITSREIQENEYSDSVVFWARQNRSNKMYLRIDKRGNIILRSANLKAMKKYSKIHAALSIQTRLEYCRNNVRNNEKFERIFETSSKEYNFNIEQKSDFVRMLSYPTYPSTNIEIVCDVDLSFPDDIAEDLNKLDLVDINQLEPILSKTFTSDVVNLKCEEQTMFVHSHILKSRSSVLMTMLTIDMEEKHSNEIIIPDISFTVLNQLIVYLYSDIVPKYSDSTKELFRAADKYDIRCLGVKLEEQLADNIIAANYLEMLYIADFYKLPRLKSAIIKFIKEKL